MLVERKIMETERRDIVFAHYRLGGGYICLAIKRPPKDSNSTVYRVAAAFGNPNDSVNRRLARKIALGRLDSDRKGRSIEFECAKPIPEVFDSALLRVLSTDSLLIRGEGRRTTTYAPMWAREALTRCKPERVSKTNESVT